MSTVHGGKSFEESNFEEIGNLKPGEQLGLDSKGHIYRYDTSNFFSAIFHIIYNIFSQKKIAEINQQYRNSLLHDKTFSTHPKFKDYGKIEGVINKNLLRAYSDDINIFAAKVKVLTDAGVENLLAETQVSLELANSDIASFNYRNFIKPQKISSDTYLIHNRYGHPIALFKESKPNKDTIVPQTPATNMYQIDSLLQSGFFGIFYTLDTDLNFYEPNKEPTQKGVLQELHGIPVDEEILMETPPEEIHKIALMDILYGNTDRNLLDVMSNPLNKILYPLNNSECLTAELNITAKVSPNSKSPRNPKKSFWANPTLKQATVPFDEKTKTAILSYNITQAMNELKKMGYSENVRMDHKMRALFLQHCIRKNLTLDQINKLYLQKGSGTADDPYELTFLDQARNAVLDEITSEMSAVSEENFFDKFNTYLEKKLNSS